MFPVLQIGPLSLRTPGLLILLGVFAALETASRVGAQRQLDPDRIYNIGFYPLIAGVIGARLGFVILNMDIYTSITPLSRALLAVITPIPGTELLWVGAAVAVGYAFWYQRRWKLDLLPLLDALAAGLPLLVTGIMLAHLASGTYYGTTTTLPWGINLWEAARHPTQVYLALSTVGLVLVLWRNRNRAYQPGELAQWVVIWLSVSILLIEPLRADSPVIFGDIRLWQVFSLLGLLGAVAGYAIRAPQTKQQT